MPNSIFIFSSYLKRNVIFIRYTEQQHCLGIVCVNLEAIKIQHVMIFKCLDSLKLCALDVKTLQTS